MSDLAKNMTNASQGGMTAQGAVDNLTQASKYLDRASLVSPQYITEAIYRQTSLNLEGCSNFAKNTCLLIQEKNADVDESVYSVLGLDDQDGTQLDQNIIDDLTDAARLIDSVKAHAPDQVFGSAAEKSKEGLQNKLVTIYGAIQDIGSSQPKAASKPTASGPTIGL